MSQLKKYWKQLRATPPGRFANVPVRIIRALPIAARPLLRVPGWAIASREDTNFTYGLLPLNQKYLAHAVALATGGTWQEARSYIEEAKADQELADHVIRETRDGPDTAFSDLRVDLHKRLGWYAVVRMLRPNLVVETGVDKGLGTVVLAAALLKNGNGRVIGTDINPAAGNLLKGKYRDVGEILYGDSIESLKNLSEIDLFINDSDHSEQYERDEYATVADKLTPRAVVLADNAHVTTALMEWAEANGWRYLFWKEEPERHWYPGGGIGFAFRDVSPRSVRR